MKSEKNNVFNMSLTIRESDVMKESLWSKSKRLDSEIKTKG